MICGRFTVVSHVSTGGSAGRRRALPREQRAARRRIGLDPSCRRQPRHRHHAGAREVGDMIDALERLPRLLGHRHRHHRHQQRCRGKNGQRKAAAHAKRIGAPDQPQHRNGEHQRHDQLRPQPRKDREQERESVAIDDQEIEECQRQLQDVELEARHHDQQHHQDQRQRRADARPRQHEQEQAIDEHPRQQRQRDRERSVFPGQQDAPTPQDAARRPCQRRHRSGRRAAAAPVGLVPGSTEAVMLDLPAARGFSRNRRRSAAG